jgi:gliding motility-associated-like protein
MSIKTLSLLTIWFFILAPLSPVFAQHADLGSGALKDQIWWINWAGTSIANGSAKTISTDDGLTLAITISNVSSRAPVPSIMNSYFGAMLHVLYDFSDPTIRPSLFDNNATGICKFSLSISASRNGIPVSFYMITADAEASWTGETTTVHTNGSPWQTMTLFRNSAQTTDPLAGCGTQTAAISETFDGQAQHGQNPIITTLSPTTGPLVVDITLDHAATFGGMAVAFGILQSEDRGDLPASYGYAQHQLLYNITNPCGYLPPTMPSLDQDTRLGIGNVPPDADPIQYTDDNAIGADEEGVAGFPAYDGSGTYSLPIVVGNTTGHDAWLSCWFDFNRDGVFSASESSLVPVPNNASSVVAAWTHLPQYLPQGTASAYGFRFRLSSDLVAVQSATGFAPDGEVEDYLVPAPSLCIPPAVSISPVTDICPGQPAPLHASGGITYSWSPITGLSDPSGADPIATPVSTTSYVVTASNPQGCSANASITVTVKPSPTVSASDDILICQGKRTSLQSTGALTYTWTSSNPLFHASGSAISVSPFSTTKYYVQGTAANGCTAIDSVRVNVHPLPVFAATPQDGTICLNDSILLTASGGDSFTWTTPDGSSLPSSSSVLVSPAGSSSYQVLITDNICQLSATLNIPVIVKDLPLLSVTSTNNIDCTLGQATLHATGARSWLWAGNGSISDSTVADPIVSPTATTTWHVKGTGANSCSSLDSITVAVDFTTDLSQYPVPSAFSPNNDGNNDCFRLKYWGRINSLELAVFNRQGARVFFTTDPQQCWDGTFKGTPQPAGAYVYQIKATTACGLAYRKGIVILVR